MAYSKVSRKSWYNGFKFGWLKRSLLKVKKRALKFKGGYWKFRLMSRRRKAVLSEMIKMRLSWKPFGSYKKTKIYRIYKNKKFNVSKPLFNRKSILAVKKYKKLFKKKYDI